MQWISIRETNCTIHWIEIYPLDSAIQRLNNRGSCLVTYVSPLLFLASPVGLPVACLWAE